jgi:glycosyltransferase involved in cell wall biosynthesis
MACFVITTGAEDKSVPRYFFALGSALRERGHRVVMVLAGKGELPSTYDHLVEIESWPSARPVHLRDFRFFWRLLGRCKPDCVIGNFGAVNVVTVASWLRRVPTRVVWYHTLSKQLAIDNAAPSMWRTFQHYRKRLVYSQSTHIIANSNASRLDVQEFYKVPESKCAVLGFLLPEPSVPPIDKFRERIVCVGRLHRSKGQDLLIRAMQSVRSDFPGARAIFVGGGPELENYRQLATSLEVADRCDFLGSLSLQGTMRQFAMATICVVASRSEAFGLVNIEAHSVGTPVVAADVDGIRDIVIDGETGYLVPPDDSTGFAHRIKQLLSDEQLCSTLSRKARLRFEEYYSLKNVDQHAAFFEDLIRRT